MLHIPPTEANPRDTDQPSAQHYLGESQGSGRKRSRCVNCYKKR